MIDIKKLADECGLLTPEVGVREGSYSQLKQFAEAYHSAIFEHSEPVAETAGNSVKWLHKRLSNFPCGIKLYTTPSNAASKIVALQAEVNELREALESCKSALVEVYNDESVPKDLRQIADESHGIAKCALAATTAQCLQEHDTKILQDALKERSLKENKYFSDKVLNDFYDSVKG